jgi:hypothetical protein
MMDGMTDRPQKITFAELRDMGVHGVPVYCAPKSRDHRGRARRISGARTLAAVMLIGFLPPRRTVP